MAGGFGDAAGVRRLGQVLVAAGRGLPGVTGDLSGRVHGLIPSGWSGNAAEAFSSDWHAKVQQAGRLAAVCTHVGQVLTGLADQLDAANRQADQARQMTGGPASRFALGSTERKSQQMLSQASGSAQQARAAARSRLAGIAVPKIGPPLTTRQVTAWAGRLAPPPRPSTPWYDSLWHGAESGGLGLLKSAGDLLGLGPVYGDPSFGQTWDDTAHQANDFAAGFAGDGLLGTLKGLGDLVGMGPLYGDPPFAQTWEGMGHLAEPWNWSTFTRSWEGLGKGLLAWNEWKSDPSRAEGEVAFNTLTLGLGPLLKLGDAGEIAADTGRVADTAARAGSLEGKTEYVVRDPADPGRTITDIDQIQGGTLWEEKSATDAKNIPAWVNKHIYKKFDSYLEARRYIPGYQHAPIGFRFTSAGAAPAFRSAVEAAVGDLRKANPGVRIRLEWSK